MTLLSELKRTFFVLKNSGIDGWFIRLISILVMIIILSSYLIYKISYQNIYNRLELEANNIDRYFAVLYQESTLLASYIGAEIADGNVEDNERIAQLLKDFNNIHMPNLPSSLSWNSLGWVNASGMLTVNTNTGVLDHNIDMTYREYFPKVKLEAMHLKVSPPDTSIPDGAFIIPAGMSITNKSGQLVGIMAWGFNIANLIQDLSTQLLYDTRFMVCGETLNLYLASEISLLHKYKNLGGSINPDISHINTPIFLENNIYLYNKQSSSMPMIIFVGYNKYTFFTKLLSDIAAAICVIMVLGIICTLFMLYTSSMLVDTINATEKRRKKFIMEVNYQLSGAILEVLDHSRKAISEFDSLGELVPQQIHTSLNTIISSANTLYTLTINSSESSNICLNTLIEEALKIQLHDILAKAIHIDINLEAELPQIYANPLSIKQVIVSVISRAILHCAHSDKITIDTYCQIANNIPTVCMIFQDTGFGSSDEDMKRIRNNSFNNKFENAHTRDHSHLALDDIKRIITANHGKYSIYHDNQNGNTIEISFTVYKKLVLQPIAQSSSIGKA